MHREFRDSSAEAWIEESRAEAKLAQMDLIEDLAVLTETEECPRLRRQLRECYQAAVGVRPELRSELRAAMRRVMAGGGMPVEDVIDLINRNHHANGSASASIALEGSAEVAVEFA